MMTNTDLPRLTQTDTDLEKNPTPCNTDESLDATLAKVNVRFVFFGKQ